MIAENLRTLKRSNLSETVDLFTEQILSSVAVFRSFYGKSILDFKKYKNISQNQFPKKLKIRRHLPIYLKKSACFSANCSHICRIILLKKSNLKEENLAKDLRIKNYECLCPYGQHLSNKE